ncbi:hypothetical protein J6590_024907 [Homalodisca vitripennis]|nr:hypothetical protein J6590_024907 [Homalodisca vitripennis]
MICGAVRTLQDRPSTVQNPSILIMCGTVCSLQDRPSTVQTPSILIMCSTEGYGGRGAEKVHGEGTSVTTALYLCCVGSSRHGSVPLSADYGPGVPCSLPCHRPSRTPGGTFVITLS